MSDDPFDAGRGYAGCAAHLTVGDAGLKVTGPQPAVNDRPLAVQRWSSVGS